MGVYSSFNEALGLGSHSEPAALKLFAPLADDAASTAVDDVSSNANDGTLVGGDNTADISTTGPNSYLTKALAFDGSNDYVNLVALGDDENVTTGTLLIWGKLAGTATQGCFEIGTGSTGGHFIGIRLASGSLIARYRTAANKDATIVASPSTGVWQLWGCAWDSSNVYGILNGAVVNTTNRSSDASGIDEATIGSSSQQIPDLLSSGSYAGALCYSGVAFDSADAAQIYNGPEPINTVAPVLSGTETEGETLSCTTGTWALDSPFSGGSNGTITYAYQWTRSNDAVGTGEADIGGATSSTYTLQAADVGKYIRCRVRASNDGGFDSAADTNSNMSGAIASSGGATVAGKSIMRGAYRGIRLGMAH